jgi:hypothetical protein
MRFRPAICELALWAALLAGAGCSVGGKRQRIG